MKAIATIALIIAGLVKGDGNVPLWKKELTKAEYEIMHLPSVFEEWSSSFAKEYKHEEEKIQRFQIWLKNVESIVAHNSKEDETYKMRLNQFGDLTNEEFVNYVHGSDGKCLKGNDNMRRLSMFSATSKIDLKVNSNPESIDWTNVDGVSYVTPVKNQGSCGSCWAFSTTGSVECNTAIKTGKTPPVSLSEQQLVDCSKKDGNLGCDGGEMDDAFKYIEGEGGLCTENDYEYTGKDGTCEASKCTSTNSPIESYTDVTKDNEQDLETAVASGCVSVAIEADQSAFQFYSGGVLSGTCGTNLDHGVLVVGYGVSTSSNGLASTQYWKVKNSWGETWGEEGYVLICKECGKNGNAGECGIASDPSFPIPKQ